MQQQGSSRRTAIITLTLVTLAIVVTLVAGCSFDDPDTNDPAAPPPPVNGIAWRLEGGPPSPATITWDDETASGSATLTISAPTTVGEGVYYDIDARYKATKTQKAFPEQLGVELGIIDYADPYFVVQPEVVTIPKGQSKGPITAEVRSTPAWAPNANVKNRATIEIVVSGGITGHPKSIVRTTLKYVRQ